MIKAILQSTIVKRIQFPLVVCVLSILCAGLAYGQTKNRDSDVDLTQIYSSVDIFDKSRLPEPGKAYLRLPDYNKIISDNESNGRAVSIIPLRGVLESVMIGDNEGELKETKSYYLTFGPTKYVVVPRQSSKIVKVTTINTKFSDNAEETIDLYFEYRIKDPLEPSRRCVVSINSNPNGALIRINNKIPQYKTNETLLTDCGETKVKLTKESYQPWFTTLILEPGIPVSITQALEKEQEK